MIPRINIEDTFDSILSTCGGKRVKDLVGPSPAFDNADYLFDEQKIIAELKCLEVDRSGDPATANRLSRLWIKWRQGGLVAGKVPPRIDSRQLPVKCQKEMYRTMGEPLRRVIKKANKQIRETKTALQLSAYTGLLLIANDGNFIFNPAAMIHYIQSALRSEFREIRNFVFFTANMYATMRCLSKPVLFWFHFSMDDTSRVSEQFIDNLHSAWTARHQQLTGIPGSQSVIQDMEAFWQAQYKT